MTPSTSIHRRGATSPRYEIATNDQRMMYLDGISESPCKQCGNQHMSKLSPPCSTCLKIAALQPDPELELADHQKRQFFRSGRRNFSDARTKAEIYAIRMGYTNLDSALENLYLNKNLSVRQIADKLNSYYQKTHQWLRGAGIVMRTRGGKQPLSNP